MSRSKGAHSKRSLLALHDMERLALNPIEMLKTVYEEAMSAYKRERGLSDKGDAGPGYLAIAGKAASDLASYKHPKLSAIAIQDFSDDSTTESLTTREAIEIIKSDPFLPRQIETTQIIESSSSAINTPYLPAGIDKDEK